MKLNKKSIAVIFVLLLVAVAGSFLIFQNNEDKQVEKQVVKKDSQKQGDENIEELKIEDIKNIKPKFGIDDSGLKYSKDGSVDTSGWKMSNTLIKFKYPESWVNTGEGIYNILHFEKLFPRQIKISGLGFAAPFDFGFEDVNDELLKKEAERAIARTQKYIKKYAGNCTKVKVDDYNIYVKCEYYKDGMLNLLYKRTFLDDNSKSEVGIGGGSAGLNIQIGNQDTLEKNKKIVNEILKSAHIEKIVGEQKFVVEQHFLK